ncbi:hypothetical protein [Marinilabilia rubra]|uniref:Uncharacterized protein n=1 Tax=Marinilabilia rubra TaxID=2162893 RepID=A0A2U2B9L9_9BACT|nr:hypothetical protein [Marinilabilia rubra]PWD99769.1 hypothetical protein DDZ16_07690 [Marinilabilia rubra]
MQLGKNRYTNSNKKAYRKPVLEVVEVDREIVLMAPSTVPPDPGVGGTGGPAGVSSFPSKNTTNTQPPSKSSNPFGGGTPDYER